MHLATRSPVVLDRVPRAFAALLCSLSLATGAAAQEARQAPMVVGQAIASEMASEAPTRLAETMALEPAVALVAATEGARDQIAALEAHNRRGNVASQNGFSRPLPATIEMRLAPDLLAQESGRLGGAAFRRQADGSTVWTVRVAVEHSYRVRLHLENVDVPDGTSFWISSEDGETAGPFGLALLGEEGDLWTPSVAGGRVTLEVRIPGPIRGNGHVPSFAVREVLEIVQLDARGSVRQWTPVPEASETCLVDGRCITSGTLDVIDPYRQAVAMIHYVKNGGGFQCTGGLLNDLDPSGFAALFLTANHCIATQLVATTVEAYWDFVTSLCGGSEPSLGSLPKSNGSTLLATGTATDFTLLLLNSSPGNRAFLGWNSGGNLVTDELRLHRLSHPQGNPQQYSRTRNEANPEGTCGSVPLSHYLYSKLDSGVTLPGSSGAPVILPGGIVVGQLRGSCAFGAEPCLFAQNEYFTDGRFSHTFPFIQEFLDPDANPGDPDPPTTGAINSSQYPDFRFWVRISDNRIGTPVAGCLPETVCVAGAIPSRAEVFLRIVGPKPNGYLWPNIVKFNTTKTEVWIRQLSTGETTYYELAALPTDSEELPGVVDKTGFLP